VLYLDNKFKQIETIMGRRKQEEEYEEEEEYTRFGLRHETQKGIVAVAFFVLALFFIFSSVGLAGAAGNFVHQKILLTLFGQGFPIMLSLLVVLGMMHIKQILPRIGKKHWISALLLLVGSLGLLELLFGAKTGGLIGMVAIPIENWFDIYVSLVAFVALITISVLVLFETKLGIPAWIKNIFTKTASEDEDDYEYDEEEIEEDEDVEEEVADEIEEEEAEEETPKKKGFSIFKKKNEDDIEIIDNRLSSTYNPPPLSLLKKQKGRPDVGDVKSNANIIKRTLHNFGIDVEMDEVSIGPTVSRYSLKPAQGVKLTRIVGLQNELALALAAHPIRIEAPIPGTSLVGIEVPNKSKSMVTLASLLGNSQFKNSPKPLQVALGQSISGESSFANLAKMPHLLIAGATGSGKSVTVHNIIMSLLYRNGPQDMRLIMVDPKRVELTLYNSIPHLLTPVIKNPKKAIRALSWTVKEMERRYDILESESVRDIQSYHETIVKPAYENIDENDEEEQMDLPERMPYIVVIIDELADIMQSYPRELEAGIVRLAQMSRAVGIHLILSTQRPSVNVITGLIKANVPARIALQVSSQVDSRTILDASGAEKLLGAGDMLYSSGEMSKPQRMQSAFISEDEVKKVVAHLKKHHDEIPDVISLDDNSPASDNAIFSASMDSDDDEDELYEDAKQTVIEAGKASTSYLQRKLRVGYSRAARLMDILEERGVIGPANGSKPREILDGGNEDEYAENEANDDTVDDTNEHAEDDEA
jgi:S-DNA-T family DNA segregation ATPase FtsK/SpoIIIE